jgi:Tol biopolymer transport system component
VFFASDESPLPDAAFGILHVASVPVAGGKAEFFTEDESSSTHPGISPDGKSVLLVKISEASGRHSLWQYSMDGNQSGTLPRPNLLEYIATSSILKAIRW